MSEYEAIKKALKRFRKADTELRRAGQADDPERLNKAGTSYAVAKIDLFRLMQLFSI